MNGLLRRTLLKSTYRLFPIFLDNVEFPSSSFCRQQFHISVGLLKKGRTRKKFVEPIIIKNLKTTKKTIEVYDEMNIV